MDGSAYLRTDPCSGVSGSTVVTSGWNDAGAFSWLGAKTGSTPYYSSTYLNRWVCIEYHMKLNAVGASDGVFEVWVDGNLDARTTGLNFRGSYNSYEINMINFEGYMNNASDSTKNRWIDHVVVATVPIGLARSPLNPIIRGGTDTDYSTAFRDTDVGNTQSAINAQVSTTASVTGLCWDGTLNGTGNTIQVNSTNGTFQGALTTMTSLVGSTIYYSRVRVSDGTDYSSWSSWYPLKTIDVVAPTDPTSVPTIGVGGFRTW
jgi:hypothetical protein